MGHVIEIRILRVHTLGWRILAPLEGDNTKPCKEMHKSFSRIESLGNGDREGGKEGGKEREKTNLLAVEWNTQAKGMRRCHWHI